MATTNTNSYSYMDEATTSDSHLSISASAANGLDAPAQTLLFAETPDTGDETALPVITITADTVTLATSITFSANANPSSAECPIQVFQFTTDGETWTNYTSGEELTVTTMDTTYKFRAVDKNGNGAEATIVFDNIISDAEHLDSLVITGNKKLAAGTNLYADIVDIAGGHLEIAEGAELRTNEVRLQGDAELDATEGTMLIERLGEDARVSRITGEVSVWDDQLYIGVGGYLKVAEGAELYVDEVSLESNSELDATEGVVLVKGLGENAGISHATGVVHLGDDVGIDNDGYLEFVEGSEIQTTDIMISSTGHMKVSNGTKLNVEHVLIHDQGYLEVGENVEIDTWDIMIRSTGHMNVSNGTKLNVENVLIHDQGYLEVGENVEINAYVIDVADDAKIDAPNAVVINILGEDAKFYSIAGNVYLGHDTIDIDDGGYLKTAAGAEIVAYRVCVETGGELDATDSALVIGDETQNITVSRVVGEVSLYAEGYIDISVDGELYLSKDQFDALLEADKFYYKGKQYSSGKLRSDGVLFVTPSDDNPLCMDDIQAIMAHDRIRAVEFLHGELSDIHALKLSNTGNDVTVGFMEGYGTEKNDTIQVTKGSQATLGDTGGLIDLLGGNNKIQLDNAANLTVRADISNISTFKTGKASYASLADVTFASGRSAQLTLGQNTRFYASTLRGSLKSTALSFGAQCQVRISDIEFTSGKNSISIGKCSEVSVTSISGVKKLSFASGSYDRKNDTVNWTSLYATDLSLTTGNDSLSFGNYTNVTIENRLSFMGGKDTLTVGSNSVVILKAAELDGLNKFTIGKNSTAYLSTELKTYLEEHTSQSKLSKVSIFDIGTADIAENFVCLEYEQMDDCIADAYILPNSPYYGWLSGDDNMDLVDFFDSRHGTTVTLTDTAGMADGDLLLTQFDTDGNRLSSCAFTGTVELDARTTAFAVSLADNTHKALAYQMQLA